jgi:hypothetical protein
MDADYKEFYDPFYRIYGKGNVLLAMMRSESKESYRRRWQKTAAAWDSGLQDRGLRIVTTPCPHGPDCDELYCITGVERLEEASEERTEIKEKVKVCKEEKGMHKRGKVKAGKGSKSRGRHMLP